MRSLVRTSGIAVVLMSISGCVHYEPHPISPQQTAVNFEARSLDAPGLKKFLERNLHHNIESWPLKSWDFETLSLAAFYYHPDLDVARAKWAIANAGMITAGQLPNPTVAFNPFYNATHVSPSPWILDLNLDIPIETANKRGYRVEQARRASDSARFNIAATAWQVRSRLHQALLELYAAEQSESLLTKQQQAREQIVHYIEQQKGLGAVSAVDVSQARIALTNVRLSVLEAQRQLSDARAVIAGAVGVTVSSLEDVKIDFRPPQVLPADLHVPDIRRAALLNRPDILTALADYAAAQAALQLEIAKQYPDVHIGPGYEFDQGDSKWGMIFSMELPLFNQNRGPIAQAEAQRRAAAVNFISLQTNAIGEIDRAFAAYESAVKKSNAAKVILADASAQRESTTKLFNAGELSKLDVMTQELELQTTEQAALDASVKAGQALGTLEDALQRPLNIDDQSLLNEPDRGAVAQEKNSP